MRRRRVYRLKCRHRSLAAAPQAPSRMSYRPLEESADGSLSVRLRAISAELVPGHWVDHRDPAHLEAAVPLFDRLPVMPMHDVDPRHWLGSTSKPEWDGTPLGPQEAPGINLVATLPAIASNETVRAGIRDGSLRRWSAGFALDAELSHDIEDSRLDALLGTEDESGELIRFVAREIVDVYEESLVDAGAIDSALTLDDRKTFQIVGRPKSVAVRFNPPVDRRRRTA